MPKETREIEGKRSSMEPNRPGQVDHATQLREVPSGRRGLFLHERPKHACAAEGCDKQVPLRFLMCGEHWAQVPEVIQKRVWKNFTPGQELGAREATSEYWSAVIEAVRAVAAAELADREDSDDASSNRKPRPTV